MKRSINRLAPRVYAKFTRATLPLDNLPSVITYVDTYRCTCHCANKHSAYEAFLRFVDSEFCTNHAIHQSNDNNNNNKKKGVR